MQGYYSIYDIPSLHKGSLSGAHNMINHRNKLNSSGFSEYLEANIKKTNRPKLLDSLCFINLSQQNYLSEI
jgi:hypothetical protein